MADDSYAREAARAGPVAHVVEQAPPEVSALSGVGHEHEVEFGLALHDQAVEAERLAALVADELAALRREAADA